MVSQAQNGRMNKETEKLGAEKYSVYSLPQSHRVSFVVQFLFPQFFCLNCRFLISLTGRLWTGRLRRAIAGRIFLSLIFLSEFCTVSIGLVARFSSRPTAPTLTSAPRVAYGYSLCLPPTRTTHSHGHHPSTGPGTEIDPVCGMSVDPAECRRFRRVMPERRITSAARIACRNFGPIPSGISGRSAAGSGSTRFDCCRLP